MKIREMIITDKEQVKDLVQKSLKSLGLDKPGTAYYDPELDDLYSFYQKQKNGQYWVIEKEDKIVGGVGIAPFIGEVCELQKLYIDQDYQGSGLSRKLMDQALSYASEYYEACYLETHSDLKAACFLYDKYEFELLEQPLEGSTHSAMDRWYLKKV